METDADEFYVEFVDDGLNTPRIMIVPLTPGRERKTHWNRLIPSAGGRILVADYNPLAGQRFVMQRARLRTLGFL